MGRKNGTRGTQAVWKPVTQAAPKVVQKQEEGVRKDKEVKCSQKAEKGFPVLGLSSSRGGADAMFSCQQKEEGSPCRAGEDRRFPQNKGSFGSCLEIFLKVPTLKWTNQRWFQL